jgi:hypothetical protein
MHLYVLGFAEIVGHVFPRLDHRWVGIVTAICRCRAGHPTPHAWPVLALITAVAIAGCDDSPT